MPTREDLEPRDEGKVKNHRPMGLKRSTPNNPRPPLPSTPKPLPLNTALPQPPAPAPHASTPLASRPQLPFPPGSTVTCADHPRPSPNFAPHTPSPPEPDTLRPVPGSASSHTRTRPASSPSLRSRLPKSSPQPPRLLHTPKPLHPAAAGSRPPAPRPSPGMWGRHPSRPPLWPTPGRRLPR